jgi:hypothetical protein
MRVRSSIICVHVALAGSLAHAATGLQLPKRLRGRAKAAAARTIVDTLDSIERLAQAPWVGRAARRGVAATSEAIRTGVERLGGLGSAALSESNFMGRTTDAMFANRTDLSSRVDAIPERGVVTREVTFTSPVGPELQMSWSELAGKTPFERTDLSVETAPPARAPMTAAERRAAAGRRDGLYQPPRHGFSQSYVKTPRGSDVESGRVVKDNEAPRGGASLPLPSITEADGAKALASHLATLTAYYRDRATASTRRVLRPILARIDALRSQTGTITLHRVEDGLNLVRADFADDASLTTSYDNQVEGVTVGLHDAGKSSRVTLLARAAMVDRQLPKSYARGEGALDRRLYAGVGLLGGNGPGGVLVTKTEIRRRPVAPAPAP